MTPDFLKKGQEKNIFGKPWKVLVVDDEPDVHAVTSIIAKDIIFENKPVKVYSAYSSNEAMEILENVPDIAVALIDVVMEKDNSGLNLVSYIREKLGNTKIRLVIRTGQPGYAPPREVILKYDINDYREKSELSSNGLFTLLVAKLREYKYITMIETQRKLLERLNFYTSMVSNKPTEIKYIDLLTEALDNISIILSNSLSFTHQTTAYENHVQNSNSHLHWESENQLRIRFRNKINECSLINVNFSQSLDDFHRSLVETFFERFALVVENHLLTQDLIDTLYEIVYIISEVTETRSVETGEHVKRMGRLSKFLAQFFGYSSEFVNMFEIAAMLHDVGKVGIPDAILSKPGQLTNEEFEIMKEHTLIGYKILSTVKHPIFQLAASVALNHHENWDGSGYPNGLKSEEIPLEARIVSLIDVYDALLSNRVYRPAWKEEDVIEYIRKNIGVKFDPTVVKVFFDVYDDVRKLYF
jgi:response regulator RpfG family c-di-GMP phosphodiesterase